MVLEEKRAGLGTPEGGFLRVGGVCGRLVRTRWIGGAGGENTADEVFELGDELEVVLT